MIPLVDLIAQYKGIRKEVDASIKKIIETAQFIKGDALTSFENNFAKYIETKYCLGVNSGTDALILGIRALELPPDSEVIIPAYTFIATALGATENGFKPVFVDGDASDYGINLSDLKRKINSRTKAIILVHLYGQPDKIDEVNKIIRKSGKKIYLIEDACQAHGANYKGKKVGGLGMIGMFSFYPGKNLGAYGDGGAITTNNQKLYKKLVLLHQYGQSKKYYHDSLGVNSRLDTLQAAILNTKLRYLDKWNSLRRKHAAFYTRLIKQKLPFIETPQEFPDRKHVYHLYVIRVPKRDNLHEFLSQKGIQALTHYPIPLHLQKAFKYLNYKKGDLPVVEDLSKNIISLPLYPEITENQQKTVISTLSEFYVK